MSRRWRRALRHPGFAVGLALTAAIVGTAVCSLVYTPQDPLRMELAARLEAPSATHPMGTDQYGRDLLSRVMRGAIASLAVGAVAVAHRDERRAWSWARPGAGSAAGSTRRRCG